MSAVNQDVLDDSLSALRFDPPAAAEGTSLHMTLLLALGTGMRRGELLGLRWTDVDLKAGTATVI